MNKNFKIVDLPKCTFNNSQENNIEELLNFFKKLGFDPSENQIKSRKVLINKVDLEIMLDNFLKPGDISNLDYNNPKHIPEIIKRRKIKTELNMLWLNYGPSFNKKTPKGKVILLDGYIE